MNSGIFTDDLTEKIERYLKETLSDCRYEHSLSVAYTAEELCKRFLPDIESGKGFFTGLVHDIAREYSKEELIEWSKKDGYPIEKWEIKNTELLHGRAGASVLKEKFGVCDEDVLEAVRIHTTGKPKMTGLQKVLFVADYIEPKRRHITPEFMKKLPGKDLDGMVFIVLTATLDYLKGKGKNIAVPALELLKEFEGEKERPFR